MKTAIGAFTKAIGASASEPAAPKTTPARENPPAAGGFDEIRVPSPDGGTRHLTRTEFEALPLAERVALLMGGKMQFFRQGHQVSARDALRNR